MKNPAEPTQNDNTSKNGATAPTRFRIPLSIALTFQVTIVAAAFIAVILVLSEQQRREFRDSLFRQLKLRQSYVLFSITAPLIKRMEVFDMTIQQYTNGYENSKTFACPSDEPGTTTLDASLPFYNHFYILPQIDSGIKLVAMVNKSAKVFPAYANMTRKTIWNIYAVDNGKIMAIENETASVCVSNYPIKNITANCFMQGRYKVPYNSAQAMRAPIEYTRSNRVWGAGFLLKDAYSNLMHVITYTRNMGPNFLNMTQDPYFLIVFTISMDIEHIVPMMYDLSANTIHSRSAVFTRFIRLESNSIEYFLIAAKKDFPDFDPQLMSITKNNTQESAWRGGKTPDPILNTVFDMSKDLFPQRTDTLAFEVSINSKKYVASAGRLYNPQIDINWLLIEYTPRDVFFSESDRARATGIAIGVVGGVIVLFACILIWLAIQLPIRSLGQAMGLAADMRNEEVIHISPILSEINTLGESFRQMNAKLLAARPFLPQSLLKASDSLDNDADDEDDEDDFSRDHAKHKPIDERSSRSGQTHDDGYVTNNSASELGVVTRTWSRQSHLSAAIANASRTAVTKKTKQQIKETSGLVMNRDLVYRRVAILSINVINFSGFVEGTDGNLSNNARTPKNSSAIIKAHTSLSRLIERTVAEERGIVDYFHGDRFICAFNTARLCGNCSRNGAEAAVKIWDRFHGCDGAKAKGNQISQIDLKSFFPNGLSMGLSVGRAIIGNHGTETMQRLATIGSVYTEATRLQDIMCRRVLTSQEQAKGKSQVNPLVAGRCLVVGRLIQELESNKVFCQIVGAIPTRELLPSSATTEAESNFARSANISIMQKGTQGPSTADNAVPFTHSYDDETDNKDFRKTVLVGSITSCPRNSQNTHEEWLYELANRESNLFTAANTALYMIWNKTDCDIKNICSLSGLDDKSSEAKSNGNDADPVESIAVTWNSFVKSSISTSDTLVSLKTKLTFAIQ